MQKIDLKNNLAEVIESLKSVEILDYLNLGNIEKHVLIKILIESKSGYDQAQTDFSKRRVFDQFEASTTYSTENFSQLFSFISGVSNNMRSTYFGSTRITDFFSFHKTLLSTLNLIDNLLFDSTDIFDEGVLDIQESQNRGNLILQVIDESKVDLKKFSEITIALKDLLETIYLLYDKVENIQFEEYPKIEMLDSGSDINFVIKIPEKAANLTAQIFKQFWDLIANNKSYRFQQKLKSVEKTISVFEKIEEAKNNKIIDPEMAEVLKKGIFENTEKIIFNNTVTKQIVQESKEYSNRQILLEKTKNHLLSETSLGQKDE